MYEAAISPTFCVTRMIVSSAMPSGSLQPRQRKILMRSARSVSYINAAVSGSGLSHASNSLKLLSVDPLSLGIGRFVGRLSCGLTPGTEPSVGEATERNPQRGERRGADHEGPSAPVLITASVFALQNES